MTRWVRNRPGRSENTLAGVAATGLGALVGLTVFYLARLVLARDPIDPPEQAENGQDAQRREVSGV